MLEAKEPEWQAQLLAEAVKTLRNDRDAKRAQALLEGYLRRYPQGVLVEEALALAIEAAAVREDKDAARLAAEYLKRYPAGRFRAIANEALSRFPD
jgi:outer membrane protein assembly factor BamD (BamD/ComL family)